MDDINGTILFDFDQLWDLPMKPYEIEFLIVARTSAGVKASKRVQLFRMREYVNITVNTTVSPVVNITQVEFIPK